MGFAAPPTIVVKQPGLIAGTESRWWWGSGTKNAADKNVEVDMVGCAKGRSDSPNQTGGTALTNTNCVTKRVMSNSTTGANASNMNARGNASATVLQSVCTAPNEIVGTACCSPTLANQQRAGAGCGYFICSTAACPALQTRGAFPGCACTATPFTANLSASSGSISSGSSITLTITSANRPITSTVWSVSPVADVTFAGVSGAGVTSRISTPSVAALSTVVYTATITDDIGQTVSPTASVLVAPAGPAPTAAINWAQPSISAPGGFVNLTWATSSATACNITVNGSTISNLCNGTSPVNVTSSSTATITAAGPGGSATNSANIALTAGVCDVAINGTTGWSATTIAPGAGAWFSWATTNASTATVQFDGSVGSFASSGSLYRTYATTGTSIATVTATKEGCPNVVSQYSLSIVAAAITGNSSWNPASVFTGGSSTYSWSFGGGSSFRLNCTDGTSGAVSQAGSQGFSGLNSQTTCTTAAWYNGSGSGPADGSTSATVSVAVGGPGACIGGQVWNGTICVCPQGQAFDELAKICKPVSNLSSKPAIVKIPDCTILAGFASCSTEYTFNPVIGTIRAKFYQANSAIKPVCAIYQYSLNNYAEGKFWSDPIAAGSYTPCVNPVPGSKLGPIDNVPIGVSGSCPEAGGCQAFGYAP